MAKNAHRILVRNHIGKRPLGRSGRRWKELDGRKVGCEDGRWMLPAWDRMVSALLNLRSVVFIGIRLVWERCRTSLLMCSFSSVENAVPCHRNVTQQFSTESKQYKPVFILISLRSTALNALTYRADCVLKQVQVMNTSKLDLVVMVMFEAICCPCSVSWHSFGKIIKMILCVWVIILEDLIRRLKFFCSKP